MHGSVGRVRGGVRIGKAWSSKVVYSLNHALSHIHLMSCKIINSHIKLVPLLLRSFQKLNSGTL